VLAPAALTTSSLEDQGTRVGLLLLAAFLVTFLIVRFWVRMQRDGPDWWPKSLEAGGTHVHHLVPGIFLVLFAGFLGLVLDLPSPWIEIVCVAFGVGAALTLDEYALWLRLDDVYWADEGRRSVDVIVSALAIGAFVVIGTKPFGLGDGDDGDGAPVLAIVLVLNVTTCIVSALRGKYYLAVVGIFVPIVALVGALRAAKPDSWWARRYYAGKPKKLAKGERRAARWSRRRTRWWDAVAGRHGA
jgi:hypothetical protein